MSLRSRIVLSIQSLLSITNGSGDNKWSKLAPTRNIRCMDWADATASKVYCEDLTVTNAGGAVQLNLQSGLFDPLGNSLTFTTIKAFSITVQSVGAGGSLSVGGKFNAFVPGTQPSANLSGLVSGDAVVIAREAGITVTTPTNSVELSTPAGTVSVRVVIIGS